MKSIKSRLTLNTILFLFVVTTVYGQTGVINGTIKNNLSQEVINGVTIRIVGTSQAVSSNHLGNFEIQKIEPGIYNLQISSLTYQTLLIEDLKVEADKIQTLHLELSPKAESSIEEVVISATRLHNTNMAVLTEIKAAHQVVSGISQQQIKMSQDRDAAQVMSRIPGLTIIDNRFAMIRGIPERYNQVMLNNAIAPSTEIDIRTFSFDLIPSAVLERMMIYKSGSPENPGDFSGGLIKVYTNSASSENFTTFSIGSNYRVNTTFKPYVYNRTSSTDFLGFNDGSRKLPKGFPTENIRSLPNSSPVRTEAPKLLNNDLSYNTTSTIPDINFGFNMGRSWNISKSKRLSMLSAINYAQSYQYYTRDFLRYEKQDPSDFGMIAPPRFKYIDERYEKENRIGLLSNWALIIDPFNKIEFKNLFNQIGENITILRNGRDFVQHGNQDRRNYMYEYRARSIYSGQLEGVHRFDGGLTSINWVVGSNYLKENQPDLRRFRTTQLNEESNQYNMELPPSSNLFDTGRYFGRLKEIGVNNSTSVEHQFGGSLENPILLKTGYLVEYRKRDFGSRYFSYKAGSDAMSDDLNRLIILPLNQIFADNNFRQDGFITEEGTNPIDSYNGTSLLSAVFFGATVPVGNFTLVGGFRGEYNNLKLSSHDAAGNPIEVNNKLFTPLAYLNIDYSIGDLQKIRFAYGRSVNRPEFREVAPFLFYDFELDANRNGNPNLKTATINNFDARYEIYPRRGETISIGGFYKSFKDPIETVVILQSESQAFTLTNADQAFSYGAELEIRKSFRGYTESKFIDKLSINLNASYIQSEVNYGNTVNETVQDARRPLQGQSPYIANAILYYHDEKKGWNISAAYNTIGPRIYAIGNVDFPTVYELPRHALDLTISKNINKTMTLKLGIQDVLNSPYIFYQDTNRDRKIDKNNDDLIMRYNRGTLFTTIFTYSLK